MNYQIIIKDAPATALGARVEAFVGGDEQQEQDGKKVVVALLIDHDRGEQSTIASPAMDEGYLPEAMQRVLGKIGEHVAWRETNLPKPEPVKLPEDFAVEQPPQTTHVDLVEGRPVPRTEPNVIVLGANGRPVPSVDIR